MIVLAKLNLFYFFQRRIYGIAPIVFQADSQSFSRLGPLLEDFTDFLLDVFIFNFRKYNHLDLEELKELSLSFAPLGVRANSLVDDHVNHSRNYRL